MAKQDDQRAERLAAALRDNLRRRKAQSREQGAAEDRERGGSGREERDD